MTSKRSNALKKGYRIEKEFQKELDELGFLTDRAERSMRIIPQKFSHPCLTCHKMPTFMITKKHDTFGCFDILAKHKTNRKWTFYFQIAANRWKSGEDKKLIEQFPAAPEDIIAMVRKDDYKPYRIKLWFYDIGEWIEKDFEDFKQEYLK